MRIKGNKGYILPLATIFAVICMIMSIGLYYSVFSAFKGSGIKEVEYIKGYYACVAGLRYASVLLKDPNGIAFNGDNYTITGTEHGGDFFNDIQTAPAKLTVTITKITGGADAGKYDVSASYAY